MNVPQLADMGAVPFTAEDQAKKDWVHAFIASAAQRVHERFHIEPEIEPERAIWHWNRNLMLMTECSKASSAYAERFGHQMPDNWAVTARAVQCAHHTNPYPHSTVRAEAFRSTP